MQKKLFCGIDPGKTGGIGLVDVDGRFVSCQRWSDKNPVSHLYLLNNDNIGLVYLEIISSFTQEITTGQIVRNQSALVNFGLWQGFVLAAGFHFGPAGGAHLISPRAWQAHPEYNLTGWQKRLVDNPMGPSPLMLARKLWPGAPLEFQADDGKAVGLLLANLARLDHAKGIDRGAQTRAREAKEKIRQAKVRAARKAQNTLATDIQW